MTGQRLSVVHRDVSPHNIILSYDGAVKLLDFGVAVSAVTEQAETMIVGKWLYMSPETTMNNQVDHRSDLFSLGVILYLLCSGYMPFTGREPKEIVRKMRAGQYKPLQELVAVPDRLAQLVARLLSSNPDHRPQGGQEVATALTEIARQHGFETSGPGIAYVLKQLFPDEVAAQFDYAAPTVIGPQDSKSVAALSPLSASHPTHIVTSPAPHFASPTSVTTVPRPPRPGGSSAVLPAATVSSSISRHSSAPKQSVLPIHPTMRRQVSPAMRVIIVVAIALLLAAGMYILVRPS
jgi:serine/threonine-protein kinase